MTGPLHGRFWTPLVCVLLIIGGLNASFAIGQPRTVVVSEDHGDKARPSTLTIDGLHKQRFTGGKLTLRPSGAPRLHSWGSSATIFIPATGEVVDMAQHWIYDPVTNSFTVPAEKIMAILKKLPRGALFLDIGLVSEDGEFGKSWTVPIRIR